MRSVRTALIFLAVWTASCQTPPVPPEFGRAESQAAELRSAGASVFFSQEFAAYEQRLGDLRSGLRKENLKLGWFRDYSRFAAELRDVLESGNRLAAELEAYKNKRSGELAGRVAEMRERLGDLDRATLSLNERGGARKALSEAAVLLAEARGLTDGERFDQAAKKLDAADSALEAAEKAVLSYISRFLEPGLIRTWKAWAEKTIEDSRRLGSTAVIITKLERKLTVYRNGNPVRSYNIGLGFSGFSVKRFEGDNATPEGVYKIIRKIPKGPYRKALLINYPNEEDRRRFELEKKKGLIPSWRGIGGSIEIHGGGEDILTRGCVSLDDDKIDELYEMVGVGTPVTIIGTLELENSIVRSLRKR